MTMNWQEVIKQEIDAAWKDGWLKGMEQKKSQVEKAKEAICADMKLEHTVEYRHALMNALTIIDRFCRGEGDEK